MSLPPQIANVFTRIDEMSLRERAMIAGAVFAVIWALWDGLLMRPASALEQARRSQIEAVATQLADLSQSIQMMAAGQSGNPEHDARRRLAELRTQALELDTELRQATRELVAPSEMAALLETVLGQTGRLRLLGMETLPAEPIVADGEETGYFRHGLAVDVRGSYLDTLQYLQALERLRWQFFWDSVELQVVEHPSSTVRIVVYTLGEREGVIGG
jgi:MSHA biogenesis protein MshJ